MSQSDLMAAAYNRLLPVATSLAISGDVGQDAGGMVWLFQGLYEDRPFRDPEGTGTSAIVVQSRSSWGSNPHNTAELDVLTVLIYSDLTRAADKSPAARDADSRASRIASQVDARLHDPGNAVHWWPLDSVDASKRLYVVSCVHDGGASVTEVPNSEGMVRAELRYHVALG